MRSTAMKEAIGTNGKREFSGGGTQKHVSQKPCRPEKRGQALGGENYKQGNIESPPSYSKKGEETKRKTFPLHMTNKLRGKKGSLEKLLPPLGSPPGVQKRPSNFLCG